MSTKRWGDLSKHELTALAEAVELWEELTSTLGSVGIRPMEDSVLHIEHDSSANAYLGWIGCNENGRATFQHAVNGPE